MLAFYFFAAIVIWLGILSLRGGLRFAAYVRNEVSKPLADFTPHVSVFAPCRGLDSGLKQNLAALFQQEYPAYEIVFVSDRADDPSLALVRELMEKQDQTNRISTKIIIAGPATDSGQKVHNLRVAVSENDSRSEVFVFVDTDARPQAHWLRSLVAPLADEKIGAASGYRWFIPVDGGLASHLRTVWNASIASALGASREKNFCWGGSTAIRRKTFAELHVAERWRGTVSDDFTLTRALHEAKLPIHFVPACLVPALDSCTMRELFEFTNRQLKITRVYAPHLWKPVLIGSLLFCLIFFGGAILIIAGVIQHRAIAVSLSLFSIIYLLGALKAHIRLKAVVSIMPTYGRELRRGRIFHLVLWPFTSALYLWNALVAAASRRIKWRGITYELKSATEAVIIARE
ncbi:MAG: glycosyltransferase family 2 protein [Blastocatellia bacterium]|nr:glycosyltransferase family 2 protein [Blastocatellia bacterium]